MDGFRVEDALAVGMPRSSLYGSRYHRPFHGVRTDREPRDHIEQCRAAMLALSPDAVFSHRSAALLHGMPLPRSAEPDEIDVCVFEPRHRPRGAGIAGHRVAPNGQRIVTRHGLTVFAAEEVWVQLGASLPRDDLVVLGDFVITGDEPYSGDPPPATWERLHDAMERHGGRRGARVLREALPRIRYGSLSPQESRLRLALLDAALPEPACNYKVFGSDGRVLAMIDLAFPTFHVAVEYLGDHHRLTATAYRQDIARRELLLDFGWDVVFVTARDDFRAVAERVRAAMRRARSG